MTDQLKSDKEVAWSTGKGDSFDLLEPTITETCDCTIKATDEIVEQTKTEKVDRFEQTEKEKEIEKVDKLEQPERTDIVELSESYFTPRTSPLIGHRVPTEVCNLYTFLKTDFVESVKKSLLLTKKLK